MNYDKKRKRQAGRQGVGSESERARIYRQGQFDGQAAVIERLIEAGILPPVTFELQPKSQEDFAADYLVNDNDRQDDI